MLSFLVLFACTQLHNGLAKDSHIFKQLSLYFTIGLFRISFYLKYYFYTQFDLYQ